MTLCLRFLVGPAHNDQGHDQVSQFGLTGPVDTVIGQCDEVYSGLDDAQKKRLGRQDLLATQAIQRLNDEKRARFDRALFYRPQELAKSPLANVRTAEGGNSDVLKFCAFYQLQIIGRSVCP